MARVIAIAYRNCIIRGIRVIGQVRPDKLKNEVQELLIAEGRYDLAEVEEPVVEKEDIPEEKLAEEIESKPKEEAEDKEATDKEKEEPAPVEDKEV